MTNSQFVDLIRSNVKGTTTVTAQLHSPMDGKMNKTGNPFFGKGIVHATAINGIIGYSYAAGVNRLAEKEGKDERDTKPHAWGDLDGQSLFRTNRKSGELYLSIKVQGYPKNDPDFKLGYFYPNGQELTVAEVKDIQAFVPAKKKSSTQADLTGEVRARDMKLDNLVAVKTLGRVITLGTLEVEQEVETASETAVGAVKVHETV